MTWTHGLPWADCDYSLGDVGIHMRGVVGPRCCRFCGLPDCDGTGCGMGKATKLAHSLDLDLVPWEERYAAAKAAIKPSRAALCLAGIMRKADDASRAGKPWKRAAVIFRFRAIMHRMPSAIEEQQAEMVNREARNGNATKAAEG